MLRDTLNSVLDNVKERTTNPFLGTLLAVWVIKNWHLVYAIFTFDSNSTLHSRLAYIEQHFKHQSFAWNVLSAVGITMLVLLTTYFFLAISRMLTETYDKIVVPLIARLTDKSSVVLKTDFIALQDLVKRLEARLEEERLAKVAAQTERDSIDKRFGELQTSLATLKQYSNGERQEVIPNSYKRLANKAKDIWTSHRFNDLIADINSNSLLSKDDEIIKALLVESLIEPSGRSSGDRQGYKFTDVGFEFLTYWNDFIAQE